MIAKRTFLLLSFVALFVLAACGGGFPVVSEPVEGAAVARTMQYGQAVKQGPEYNVVLELPEEWAGQLVTHNSGNILKFDYINDSGRQTPLFALEALSEEQYWQQIGGYPGQVRTLRNLGETIFIASIPRDTFYSGVDEETYAGMVESITEALTTISIEPAN